MKAYIKENAPCANEIGFVISSDNGEDAVIAETGLKTQDAIRVRFLFILNTNVLGHILKSILYKKNQDQDPDQDL